MVALIQNKYLRLDIKALVTFFLALMIISFLVNIRPFIFLTLFAAANSLLLVYGRYFDGPIDFEFCTFSTILMTLQFGLEWGLITAVVTEISSVIYNHDYDLSTIFSIIGYMGAALFTYLLHPALGAHIILLGIIVAAIVNIYSFIIFNMLNYYPPFHLVLYSGTNLFFNTVLFIGFSGFLLRLMML